MGGTTGGTADTGASALSSTSTLSPTGYAGSRAALPAPTAPAALPEIPSWLSTNPVTPAVNPTVAASPVMANPVGASDFNHTPYTKPPDLPHIGAPDPVVAPVAAAPTEPVKGPMHQIWPPSGGGTAASWISSNPNWQTDFNRAEQRADGSWWVPDDPKAPSPGPQYYQGTGNVIYQGSPAATGGR